MNFVKRTGLNNVHSVCNHIHTCDMTEQNSSLSSKDWDLPRSPTALVSLAHGTRHTKDGEQSSSASANAEMCTQIKYKTIGILVSKVVPKLNLLWA